MLMWVLFWLVSSPIHVFAGSEKVTGCLVIVGEQGLDNYIVSNMEWRVKRDLRIPVVTLSEKTMTNSLLGHAVELQRQYAEEYVCLISLVRRTSSLASSDRLVITGSVAVLNIECLRLKDDSSATNSVFLGRVSKAMMSSVGRILAVPPCRLPYCAMHPSRNEQEFDQKAENFCPLCLHRAKEALQAKGIQFIPRDRSNRSPQGVPR